MMRDSRSRQLVLVLVIGIAVPATASAQAVAIDGKTTDGTSSISRLQIYTTVGVGDVGRIDILQSRLLFGSAGYFRLPNYASDPTGPQAGDLYYDTTNARVRLYTTAWLALAAEGGSAYVQNQSSVDQSASFRIGGSGTLNPGTTPADAAILTIDPLGAPGTRNSHNLRLTGRSYDASAHQVDWTQFVSVTSNAGASTWTLQSRIDAGGYATRLAVTDAGEITTGIWRGTAIGALYGGTGATSVGSGGSVAYSDGTVYAFTAVGTTNQILTSQASGTPTWASLQSGILSRTVNEGPTGSVTKYYTFGGYTSTGIIESSMPQCVITSIRVTPYTNSLSGTAVFTIRQNASDTGLTVTVPAGSLAAVSATGSVSFAAGDTGGSKLAITSSNNKYFQADVLFTYQLLP